MPRSIAVLVISIASGGFLSGCTSSEVHVSPAQSSHAAVVAKAINDHCPIHPANKIDPKVDAVKFKGRAIGFCSDNCEARWKRWTLQRKNVYVAQQLRD